MSDKQERIYYKLEDNEQICKLWFDSADIRKNYTQNNAIALCRQYLSEQHKSFHVSSLLSLNSQTSFNKHIGFLMQYLQYFRHTRLYLLVKGQHENTYKRILFTVIGKPVFYGFHFKNGGILFEIIVLRRRSIFQETFWISLLHNRILYIEWNKE